MQRNALEGVRVLEFGVGVSAPFCAKLFADYGADVIKVELPGGDMTRRWGPFPGDRPHPEKSGLFFFLNTNKRGVTLDVANNEADRASFLRLVQWADVLVENHPPEYLRRWQLDYFTLSRLKPDLVMISITPFGQTGPYATWKAYDLNAYHLTASGSRYCGRPGDAPLEHGTFSADFFGGYTAAAWGLAALLGKHRAGGQHLDVSSAEAIAAVFVGCQNIGAYAQDGVFEKRTGVGMALGAPATILPAKDGHVWMMALEAWQWNGLRRALGDPEWAQLDMFQDMFVRAQNADMIYSLLEQWTREHTKQEIMDRCQANRCPTTAVFTVAEIATHPHLEERGYFVNVDHRELGTVRTMNAPVRLPACPGGPRRPAPLLGEHNVEVQQLLERVAGGKSAVNEQDRSLPLEGVRVANFGWGWLGPVAGQTLGFLGAEVYKVESRARVDINRTLPPFAGGVRDPDRSLQNHAAWAGNGSVTINLKKPEGQELARKLVKHCDVAIENFGPGVMSKLHLSYEELRAVRPDIILASLPPAGLFGPLKDIRTYGMSLSSIAGLDSITGYVGGPPVPMENAFADPLGGIVGAFAVLLALRYREQTGQGQHIDCSQQEAILQMMAPAYMDYLFNRRVAGPLGNRHPLGVGAPHGLFPCKGEDRWISIAVLNGEEWQGLVAAMGNPNWARDFDPAEQRIRRIDELHERLSQWTGDFDDYELARHLQQHGVAAAPVLNVADLLHNPHYKARGTFVEVAHPLGFRETIYGAYVKTSGPPVRITPGPVMGRDNDHVFLELMCMPRSQYEALIEQEVIF